MFTLFSSDTFYTKKLRSTWNWTQKIKGCFANELLRPKKSFFRNARIRFHHSSWLNLRPMSNPATRDVLATGVKFLNNFSFRNWYRCDGDGHLRLRLSSVRPILFLFLGSGFDSEPELDSTSPLASQLLRGFCTISLYTSVINSLLNYSKLPILKWFTKASNHARNKRNLAKLLRL